MVKQNSVSDLNRPTNRPEIHGCDPFWAWSSDSSTLSTAYCREDEHFLGHHGWYWDILASISHKLQWLKHHPNWCRILWTVWYDATLLLSLASWCFVLHQTASLEAIETMWPVLGASGQLYLTCTALVISSSLPSNCKWLSIWMPTWCSLTKFHGNVMSRHKFLGHAACLWGTWAVAERWSRVPQATDKVPETSRWMDALQPATTGDRYSMIYSLPGKWSSWKVQYVCCPCKV